MTVKDFTKNLRARWRRYMKKLSVARYNLRLRLFGWRNRTLNRMRSHFRKRGYRWLAVIYFSVSITLSLLLPTFYASIQNNDVLGLYTSIGGMTGGMLAIIFTFITLLATYALQEFPPEFFKLSGQDLRQEIIYIALALLSVTFFVLGLIYPGNLNGNYWLNAVTLLLITFVFFLVFVSYVTMRARLNPDTAFDKFIVNRAIKMLDEAVRKSDKLAKMFSSNPNNNDPDIELHARQQAQLLMRAYYASLNNYVAVIFDYHSMLREKKKERAALKVLSGVEKVILKYIEVRKDNSMIMPTQYLLAFETDSQGFFAINFERLTAKLSMYIDNNNVEGIRKTIAVYTNIGLALADIKFPGMPTINPAFDQSIGYLNQARDMAIQKKNVEAVFELAKAYGFLGSKAIMTDSHLGQSQAYDSLNLLLAYSYSTQQDSVRVPVVDSIGWMSDALFSQEDIDLNYTDFTQFVSNYKKLLRSYLILFTDNTDLSMNNTEALLKPMNHLYNRFLKLALKGSRTTNPNRTHDQHDTLEIVDTIRDIARHLADTKDTQVVNRWFYKEIMKTLTKCIYKLLDLHNKMHWRRNLTDIDSKLTWAINQFGFGLRGLNDKVERSYLDDLADMVTTVGLFAISQNNDKAAQESMQGIALIADGYLRTGQTDKDYAAPRIMMNVYHMSSVAMSLAKPTLLRYGHLLINGFRVNYKKLIHPGKFALTLGATYLGSYPDQFNQEMAKYINEQNHPSFYSGMRSSSFGDESPEQFIDRIFSVTDEHHEMTWLYLKRKFKKQ